MLITAVSSGVPWPLWVMSPASEISPAGFGPHPWLGEAKYRRLWGRIDHSFWLNKSTRVEGWLGEIVVDSAVVLKDLFRWTTFKAFVNATAAIQNGKDSWKVYRSKPVPLRPCMMQLRDFSDLQLIPEDVARYSDNGGSNSFESHMSQWSRLKKQHISWKGLKSTTCKYSLACFSRFWDTVVFMAQI